MQTRLQRSPARHTQQGAVLAISLVFLLLMTILAVSSMQGTVLQERMAGNQRDHNLAFQTAEAALRAGEDWVGNDMGTAGAIALDTGGCYGTTCDPSAAERVVPHNIDPARWDPANPDPDKRVGSPGRPEIGAEEIGLYIEGADIEEDHPLATPAGSDDYAGLIHVHVGSPTTKLANPVDPQGSLNNPNIYPITVRAAGGSENAVVILRSWYAHFVTD